MMLRPDAIRENQWLNEPTVFYRQHGGNVAGTHLWDSGKAIGLLTAGSPTKPPPIDNGFHFPINKQY